MRLTFRSGPRLGQVVEVTPAGVLIGRDPDCDIVLTEDERVSRRHARLVATPDGRAVIEDLGSSNGTFVNAQRLTGSRELAGNEAIAVGNTVLDASPSPSPPPPAAAPQPPRRARGQATIIRGLERSVRRTSLLAGLASLLALVVVGVVIVAVVAGVGQGGGGPSEPSTQEVVKAVTPATVLILKGVDGKVTGSGSGWVLDADQGLVVTNAHVVNLEDVTGESAVEVGVGSERRAAEVVGVAPCDDLAVLKVSDPSGLEPLALGSQGSLEQGETVVAVGYPGTASSDANLVATQGVVSVVRSRADSAIGPGVVALPNVVQTDAAINPGNSGGPLVNRKRELVGVNTLTNGEAENQGYAIGVDRAREVTGTLRDGKSLGWTGAAFSFLTDPSTQQPTGILLTAAFPDTGAARAGLGSRPMLLQGVDGQRIEPSIAGYCRAVGGKRQGERTRLSLVEATQGPGGEISVSAGAVPQDVEVVLE